MTSTTLRIPETRNDARWTRLMALGAAVAAAGLVGLGVTMTFWATSGGGDFQYAADYWLTAPAVPICIGMVLHVFAVRGLQHGRDGRLGEIGAYLFAICSTVIMVQCIASLFAGAELIWGPVYPLCALGSFVGVALLAAGSWRSGLLPKWMLGIWPPLMLLGSWFGQSLIPIALAAFLIASTVVCTRRVSTAGSMSVS